MSGNKTVTWVLMKKKINYNQIEEHNLGLVLLTEFELPDDIICIIASEAQKIDKSTQSTRVNFLKEKGFIS